MGRHLTWAGAISAVLLLVGVALGPGARASSPPANDDFANAEAVVVPSVVHADTREATHEGAVGERAPSCASPIGKTVWYRLTPSAPTPLTIFTEGSTFDTVVAVYTGLSLPTLEEVACDDDSGPDKASELHMTADGGTTYWIQAAGWGGESGDLRLELAHRAAVDGWAAEAEVRTDGASWAKAWASAPLLGPQVEARRTAGGVAVEVCSSVYLIWHQAMICPLQEQVP